MKNGIRVVCEDGIVVHITDAQTGAVIPGVRGVTFAAPKPGNFATVTLECICVKVDVIGDLEAVEFATVQGKRHRFELPVGTRVVDVTELDDKFERKTAVTA